MGSLKGKVLVVLVSIMLVGIANLASAKITEEGDYCWTLRITEDSNGPITPFSVLAKFHIIPIGDGTTYTMAGKIFVSGDSPPFLTGIATSGLFSNILANLTATQQHTDNSWRDTSTIRFNINPDTLKGNFYEVGLDYDKAGHTFDYTRYNGGVLIPRSCPAPQ